VINQNSNFHSVFNSWMWRLFVLAGLLICVVWTDKAVAQSLPDIDDPGYLNVIAGGSGDGSGTPALTFSLGRWIYGLDVDRAGRIYFIDDFRGAIRRTELDGSISAVTFGSEVVDFHIEEDFLYFLEGSETIGRVDLNTQATELIEIVPLEGDDECCSFGLITADRSGNIFVANSVVYRFNPDSGELTHFAGLDCGFDCSGDPYENGTPATEAELGWIIYDLAVDATDNSVVLAHPMSDGEVISRIDTAVGTITVVAEDLHIRSKNLPRLKLDLLSNGNMVYADQESHVWLISKSSGQASVLAGDGTAATAGDGKRLLEASMMPENIAVDANDNIFISSAIERTYERPVDQRIRFLDLQNDVVFSVIGAPGSLACQSPTDSTLLEVAGITADSNGIAYLTANSAILAIDTKLDIVYSVAGLYGFFGVTEDGQSAFGNKVAPDGVDLLAAGPDGHLYFTENDRLRRINSESGLLETVAQGQFRWLDFSSNGELYAVRQDFFDGTDVIIEGLPDFVRIDTDSGAVEYLVRGGDAATALDESAENRDFRSLLDFSADSDGNLYLLLGYDNYGNEGVAPGLYRIDAQSGTLRAVLSGDDISDLTFGGLALDEENGLIYLSGGGSAQEGSVPVMLYDMASGERVRFAGAASGGVKFDENPLNSDLDPTAIALGPNGDLYLVDRDWRNDIYHALQISRSKANSELLPDDIQAGANVGQSVVRSGNWLAIAAPKSNRSDLIRGEVLVYLDNGCRTILRDRLVVPGAFTAGVFGKKLVFAGNTLVIAADDSDSQSRQSAPLENGTPFHLGIFRLKNRNWSFEDELSGYLPSGFDGRIETLVSSGSLFAVGSPNANDGEGAVLVFDSNNPVSPVRVGPVANLSNWGRSLAMDEGRLVVGGISAQGGGAAALLGRNGNFYELLDLAGSNDDDPDFGASLALNDQSLYLGAPAASGGRVHDFAIDGGFLFPVDELADPENPANPSFGSSLAIEGDVLVVGAPETDVASAQKVVSSLQSHRGETGIQAGETTGMVHLFGVKDQFGQRQIAARLLSLFASSTRGYGRSLDISKGRIVVGAPDTNDGRGTFDSVSEVVDAARLSGLWYDPDLDGEGFNVLVADAGMVVYFYGYDGNGERLWLVSETLTADFRFDEEINLKVYKSREGEFDAPLSSSRSLVEYGLLSMSFGSLESARFTVTGFDGSKFSRATFLADVGANQAAFSGLWYDPQKDGEGFNVISGVPGTVIYYYGSSATGERLWLVSDLLTNDISDGTTVSGTMYEAVGGDFYHPAPSATALRNWGTIEARFDDCNGGRFLLTGSDGNKSSDVVKLAGVGGAKCDR
jgi:hypothetical protein